MANPEKIFRIGAIRASIFRNSAERNGKKFIIPKVSIEARYKDKNGEWKGSKSFSRDELPKAILALQKAYEYLLEHRNAPASDESLEEEIPTEKIR